jgi:hypothetical protein
MFSFKKNLEELELRQKKSLISKESLVICIEDPEKPIGSGGATLNALLVVIEALSAQHQYKVLIHKSAKNKTCFFYDSFIHQWTQVEVLKEKYILIMHMGRQYPVFLFCFVCEISLIIGHANLIVTFIVRYCWKIVLHSPFPGNFLFALRMAHAVHLLIFTFL